MNLPVFSIYLDTRKLAVYSILAVVLGGLFGGVLWDFGGIYVSFNEEALGFGSMNQFNDMDHLKTFLNERGVFNYGKGWGFPRIALEGAPAPSGETLDVGVNDALSNNDYSGTNIQVEGVDEGDIVKTDGNYLYLAKNNTIIIILAYPPGDAMIVSKIKLDDTVNDLFLSDDKLVVFTNRWKVVSDNIIPEFFLPGKDVVTITVFDISNKDDPVQERQLSIDGNYFSSRMIGEYVYFIIKNPANTNLEYAGLPIIREGKIWSQIQAEDLYYHNVSEGWMEYTTIMAVNVHNPEKEIYSETFLLDNSASIYVSLNNLYLASWDWDGNTTITKIHISEGAIKYMADGVVNGRVLNQFSMDEHDGIFRIATTSWEQAADPYNSWALRESNNVYTLNEEMKVIGSLTGLAPNESIFSARFISDRCYLVTFKKVDPLFTIDLSDPENPKVLGKLKIPGFSNYLHPYDENILIGIGQETVEAEQGDFAWYQGIKISLFDVSNINDPKELAKIEVGDRGSHSPAQWDHHAFLFSKKKSLLVIPILEAKIDKDDFAGKVPPSTHGEYVYQGAYVFYVSPEGITLRGRVTHIDDSSEFTKSGYWFYSERSVKRSLYINDVLYTISDAIVKLSDFTTLNEIVSIELR
jgi:uncharacterized secreted protein with C-terminal beta-propeller domain